jgi:hypothetical protein
MYFCVFSIYKGISVIFTLAENYEILQVSVLFSILYLIIPKV